MTDAIVSIGTPSKLSDGLQAAPRLTALGYTRSMPFMLQSVLEGRCFHASVGSESTPISFSTTYDEDQPEAVIEVPDGTVMIPVFVNIAMETAAGTITSYIIGGCENAIGAGTSTTPMTLGIDNMLVSTSARASACISHQAYSGNSSALTNKREFWRKSLPFVDAAGVVDRNQIWAPFEAGSAPILKGPASFIVWTEATATAPTGYIEIAWIEYLTSELGI